MVGLQKHISILVLILVIMLSEWGLAQTKLASIWATTRFNKEQVMVGEPLVVTVTVYTSTWFTKPPVYSEIQVRGAVMTRLQTNGGSRSVTIGRKQYPAIEQRFVIYPTVIGENTLPPIEIITTSPPEGGYKGLERTIETKPRSFEVLPPPEGVDTAQWLSAYDLSLTETWDRPLRDLKAGDIFERRITIKAQGALAAFIAPVVPEKPDFGTIYPQQPILGNIQGNTLFNGSRTEILTYLLEEDGTFTIPEVSVQWFNLRNRELETETIPSSSIDIADNPDLEFILSRQKELQEELARETEQLEEVAEEPFEFMGLNWWQLTLVVLASLGLLSLIYRWIKKLELNQKEAKIAKMQSEPYLFKELEKAVSADTPKRTIQALANWYDTYRQGKYGASLYEFAQDEQQVALLEQLVQLGETAYKENRLSQSANQLKSLFKALSETRSSLHEQTKSKDEQAWMNINPTTG